jgi:hypothetical protein
MAGGASTLGVKAEEVTGRLVRRNLGKEFEELGHHGRDDSLGGEIRDLVPYVAVKDEGSKEEANSEGVEVEFELDDEELAPTTFLAMARFYSGKRFNERGLFDEMCVAWGLPSLSAPKILGDNRYLLEFDSMVVRDRNVEGGPWRHKGGG